MNNKGFSYRFTIRELRYLLFTKKQCPECRGELIRSKDPKTVKGSNLNDKTDPVFIPDADIKSYHYSFHCVQCGRHYTLHQLAYRKG